MNIRFEYEYRDAGNYKNRGSIVVVNDKELDLEKIEEDIRDRLIDSEFFVAERLRIPTLYFPDFDESVDHFWHRFVGISCTSENATLGSTISELIRRLQLSKPPL